MFVEVMVKIIYVLATRVHLRSACQIESARVVLKRFLAHDGLLTHYVEASSLELNHDSHQRDGVA